MADEKQGRGQDPDKTTGQERADEVHERNAERIKDREAHPEQLPSKPQEEELPEGGDVSEDELDEIQKAGEEDADFVDEEKAAADESIDDAEKPDEPLTREQLPEGAHRDDYGDD
jgi:hypothetical protein